MNPPPFVDVPRGHGRKRPNQRRPAHAVLAVSLGASTAGQVAGAALAGGAAALGRAGNSM